MIGVLTHRKPCCVEEAVDRLGDRVAHARQRADHVGARAQVRDLAQELERVRLGLDRIRVGIVDPADTRTASACISNGCPFAGDGTILPVASTAHPAVRCITSLA
jgi:hypothetical protein